MSDLIVEISALHQAAQNITAASKVADDVHGKGFVLEAESQAAAGRSDAGGALANLFSRWGYGAGHLHTDADELAKALGTVVTAFTDLEQKLTAAMTPKGH